MTRARRSTLLTAALLMILLSCTVVPETARAGDKGYAMRVDLVMLRDVRTQRTDAGLHVSRDGGAARDLEEEGILVPGDTLRVLYSELKVYLSDPDGNRFVVECPGCTEGAGVELVIGDPAKGEPFVQTGGRVTYRVEKVRSGIFEILLKVLIGPEDRTIPVGAKGTAFMLESSEEAAAVTVADGTVTVGGPETGGARDVAEGVALASRADGWREAPAAPEALARILEITSPAAVPSWGRPPPKAPRPPAMIHRVGPWVTLGVGVAAGAAGGALHYLAARNEADAASDARGLCGSGGSGGGTGAATGVTASEDASTRYDKLYNRNVRPLEISAWALYGAGAAMVVGGIVWALVRPTAAPTPPGGAWFVSPLPGGGLSLGTAWTL